MVGFNGDESHGRKSQEITDSTNPSLSQIILFGTICSSAMANRGNAAAVTWPAADGTSWNFWGELKRP